MTISVSWSFYTPGHSLQRREWMGEGKNVGKSHCFLWVPVEGRQMLSPFFMFFPLPTPLLPANHAIHGCLTSRCWQGLERSPAPTETFLKAAKRNEPCSQEDGHRAQVCYDRKYESCRFIKVWGGDDYHWACSPSERRRWSDKKTHLTTISFHL